MPGTFRVVATDTLTNLADTSAVIIEPPLPTLEAVVLTPASVTLQGGAAQQFSCKRAHERQQQDNRECHLPRDRRHHHNRRPLHGGYVGGGFPGHRNRTGRNEGGHLDRDHYHAIPRRRRRSPLRVSPHGQRLHDDEPHHGFERCSQVTVSTWRQVPTSSLREALEGSGSTSTGPGRRQTRSRFAAPGAAR